MKTAFLALLCLFCLTVTAEANHALWVQPEIIPHTVLRDDGNGNMIEVPNPYGYLPQPQGIEYIPANFDAHVADAVRRTLIYAVDSGGNTDAEIIAAVSPGFRESRESAVKYDAQKEINALDSYYLSGDSSSWGQIHDEVSRWGSDGIQTTPFSDLIAASAEMSREAYLTLMKAKIQPYDSSKADIIGRRLAIINQIYSSQSIDELLSLRWQQGVIAPSGMWQVAQ